MKLMGIGLLALSLTLSGCAGLYKKTAQDVAAPARSATFDGLAEAAVPYDEAFEFSGAASNTRLASDDAPAKLVSQEDSTAPQRLMIYEANLGVVVANADETLDRFVRAVEAAGGYLLEKRDRRVSCRVPVKAFDETVRSVKTWGRVVLDHVTARDVSREYRDLSIRLENSEKARDRLIALLGRAEDVEAILAIEAQLTRLTEEVERMKGELRYLTERIAYSLINVEFQQPVDRGNRSAGRPSRFTWINRLGVRFALERF